MGYTTDFTGSFEFDKPLDIATYNFLVKLAQTRRMKRNLPTVYGIEGEFFVDGLGHAGQGEDESIIDYNNPPRTQPGLWCQWSPTGDKKALIWDGNEKFYNYIEWLEYLIKKVISLRGYTLNGTVKWQGENPDDFGQITVTNNTISILRGTKVYT